MLVKHLDNEADYKNTLIEAVSRVGFALQLASDELRAGRGYSRTIEKAKRRVSRCIAKKYKGCQ